MNKTYSLLTLTSYNKKGEVTKSEEYKNILSTQFFRGMEGSDLHLAAYISSRKLQIGDKKVAAGNSNKDFISGNKRLASYIDNSFQTSGDTEFDGSDLWVEFSFRVDSTGSVETIRQLGLSESTGTSPSIKVLNYVAVDPEYVQQPAEIIDIKLRLLVEMPADKLKEIFLKRNLLNRFNYSTPTTRDVGMGISPYCESVNLNKIIASFTNDLPTGGLPDSIGHANTYVTNIALSKDAYVGTRLGTINRTQYYSFSYGNEKIIKNDNVPNYPLSALFNHTSASIRWDEDITQLATGRGYPVVKQDNPTWNSNSDTAEYGVEITKSGNVNLARFIKRIRDVSIADLRGDGQEQFIPLIFGSDTGLPFHVSNLKVGINPWSYIRMSLYDYDEETLMVCREGTISLHNMNTLETVVFNEESTPAITAMGDLSTSSMCRDTAGNIYFIKPGTLSIVVITDPFGATPNIQIIDESVIGNTTAMLVMCQGADNRVWMASADGIFYTDDVGASFTKQPDYTNANAFFNTDMVRINRIVCNPNNNDELMLGFTDSGSMPSSVFARTSSSKTNYVFYNSSTNEILDIKGIDNSAIELSDTGPNDNTVIVCDPVYGLWLIQLGYNDRNPDTLVCKFGTSKYKLFGFKNGNYNHHGSTGFSYDALGNIIIKAISQSWSNYQSCALSDLDGVRIGSFKLYGNYSAPFGTMNQLRQMNDKGLSLIGARQGFMAMGKWDNHPHYTTYASSSNAKDTLILPLKIRTTNDSNNKVAPVLNSRLGNKSFLVKDLDNIPQPELWDSINSEWKKNWNRDTPESSDGSKNDAIPRVNFEADSNEFSGRSYLNATSVLTGTDLSANGLSVYMLVDGIEKDTNSNAPDFLNEAYSHNEVGMQCLVSLYDETGKIGFNVMLADKDKHIIIEDYTDGTGTPIIEDLGASTIPGTKRFVVTIDGAGQDVTVWKDDTELGSMTLTNALDLDASSNVLVMHLGMTIRNYLLDTPNITSGFKGDMTNIQIWAKEHVTADIAADYAITQGGGLVAANADLLSRFLMDADYNEGRACVDTFMDLGNDFNIRFPDGDLTAESYIKGNFYNALSVKDAIVKSNIQTFDWTVVSCLNQKETDDITAPDDTSVIPGAESIRSIPTYLRNVRLDYSQTVNGNSYTNNSKAVSYASTAPDKDYEVEFTVTEMVGKSGVYFKRLTTLVSTYNTNEANPEATLELYDSLDKISVGTNSTATADVVLNYDIGDSFKMKYEAAGNLVISHKPIGGNYTQVSSIPMNVPIADFTLVIFSAYSNLMLLQNMTTTLTIPAGVMMLGDESNETGLFDKTFMFINREMINTLEIEIDGVPADYTIASSSDQTNDTPSFLTNLNDPGAGSAIAGNIFGFIKFDSTDYGKTVTLKDYVYTVTGTG